MYFPVHNGFSDCPRFPCFKKSRMWNFSSPWYWFNSSLFFLLLKTDNLQEIILKTLWILLSELEMNYLLTDLREDAWLQVTICLAVGMLTVGSNTLNQFGTPDSIKSVMMRYWALPYILFWMEVSGCCWIQ